MERVQFLTHRGVRVMLLDLTGLADTAEIRRVAEAAKETIAREPKGSVLLLTDAGGSRYDGESLGIMKEVAAHNTPYLKSSAVVATSATHKAAIATVGLFTGRSMKSFSTRDEALDWLVAQG